MSWSYTVLGKVQDFVLPADLIEEMSTQHIAYPADMQRALDLAKVTGLMSATCTGGRTPNPYGGPETIDISVMGTVEPVDINEMIRQIIKKGPDDV
jgi:hypothetical protein